MKYVRTKDGWPYQFEDSTIQLKWFQQPVDCARHAAQERGTEIFGGPH
jgi:hypothetical protein